MLPPRGPSSGRSPALARACRARIVGFVALLAATGGGAALGPDALAAGPSPRSRRLAWTTPPAPPAAPSEPSTTPSSETPPVPAPEPPPPPDVPVPPPAPSGAPPPVAAPPAPAAEPSARPPSEPPPPPEAIISTPAPEPLGPPASTDATAPAVPAAARPKFALGLGYGYSFDNDGLLRGRTVAIPTFVVEGAVGQGVLGFEARLFATAADGRFHELVPGAIDMPVDRLAVDLQLAGRPLALVVPEQSSWVSRFARSLTVAVGPMGEHAAVGTKSHLRYGAVLTAHADLPLFPSEGQMGDLRLRFVIRRELGQKETIAGGAVQDSKLDLFAALILVL